MAALLEQLVSHFSPVDALLSFTKSQVHA